MIDPIFKENNERIKFDTMLNKATKGLRVDYRELVNYIESLENNNISPLNLKKLLITQALKLTNINNYNNLDWRFVASRLVLFGLFEEASKTRSYNNQMGYSNSYYDFLNDAVNNHLYNDKILKSYSKAEIDEISKEINPE